MAMNTEFVFTAHGDTNLLQTKKPPDRQQSTNPKPSFRGKLLGDSHEILPRPKEDMIEKKIVRIELENGNRLLPKVYLEPQTF